MKMPINTQTGSFKTLRLGTNGERPNLYVDKTKHIYNLLEKDRIQMAFLSRPRRFGKTLTISTLEALFKGERELFDSLYMAQNHCGWYLSKRIIQE